MQNQRQVTSFRIDPDLAVRLDYYAKTTHQKKGDLINESIRRFLDGEGVERGVWTQELTRGYGKSLIEDIERLKLDVSVLMGDYIERTGGEALIG